MEKIEIQRETILNYLKKFTCYVEFEKKDGTKRTMRCTLMEDIVPQKQTTEKSRKSNPNQIRVWDLEKSAWRSFTIDSIFSITLQ